MKTSFLSIVFILIGSLCKAQVTDPVQWKFFSVKIGVDTYEIHLAAVIEKPWHLYSQSNEKGGPVSTTVIIKPNPLLTVEKPLKEIGKPISKEEDAFGMVVRYYEGNVEFVTKVHVRKGLHTNLAGSIHYMTCNDQKCLPAVTVPFNVKLN